MSTSTSSVESLTLLAHRRTGSLLLLIVPADRDGDVVVLNPNGSRGEIRESALLRDYTPLTVPYADAVSPRLSDRARRVLWTTAAHAADVCPLGLEPGRASALAALASLTLAQLTPTLNRLLAQGLICPWVLSENDVRYVPSITGILALNEDAPTSAQMRARRSAR